MEHIRYKLSHPLTLVDVSLDLDIDFLLASVLQALFDTVKLLIFLKAFKFELFHLLFQAHDQESFILQAGLAS